MATFITTIDKGAEYDIVIVGAGISGMTLGERYAHSGKRVLIVEHRNHIGGNCYDYSNEQGILVALYGPHYFHTNDEGVWQYVSQFSQWQAYEHRVIAHVDGKKVPVPVNIDTLNRLFNANINTSEEAERWFEEHKEKIENPKNAEEAVLARMGTTLYELLFKGYTTKQWGMDPKELAPEVTNRIPLRLNNDDRYFTDKYQALPINGYTKLFEAMIQSKNITIMLNTEWDEVKDSIKSFQKLFFTGRIDHYFKEQFGPLQYRSLRFEFETLEQEYFQEYAQENYPSLDVPFTRIVEYKRATGQKHPKTTISREYSTWEGEPYYPVPSEHNQKIYEQYQHAASELEQKGIYFVGRLANYKYFNMDQAFRNALNFYNRLEGNPVGEIGQK
jgi:UDP-galactopyranose mutase